MHNSDITYESKNSDDALQIKPTFLMNERPCL